MQVNGILGAKYVVLRAACRSGASGERRPACCWEERCRWRGAVQVERGGASGEDRHPARCLEVRRRWRGPSCLLLGGTVRVERRPACCWVERCKRRGAPSCMLLDGAVRMVGKCRECRRGVRAQHAPPPAAGTRRFPPQLHAACAPLQTGNNRVSRRYSFCASFMH